MLLVLARDEVNGGKGVGVFHDTAGVYPLSLPEFEEACAKLVITQTRQVSYLASGSAGGNAEIGCVPAPADDEAARFREGARLLGVELQHGFSDGDDIRLHAAPFKC